MRFSSLPDSKVYDPSTTGPGFEFFGADPNLRTPYTQNFNLNLQQGLGGKAVFQVGYVGTKGTKLFRFRDIDQPSQAQITAYDLANGVSGYGVPRVFTNSDLFFINMEESKSNSIYHALQTSLRMNNWRGLSSNVNFVWSHAMDDASDSEDFTPNQAQPTDSFNPGGDRGNSSFDIRRRFTWNFAYEFPKMGGSFAKLKNGWGFDGVVSLQDGQPFHLNYLFEGDYSGAGQGFDRPDVVGPIRYGNVPFNFLDMTAFAAPCTFDPTPPIPDPGGSEANCLPGTRHFGNLGRNSLRGPSFKEFNFTLVKNTALTEHVNLKIQADFFNLFNHPNFRGDQVFGYTPSSGVNCGPVDSGTGLYAPCSPTNNIITRENPTNQFGQSSQTTTRSGREMQYGLKISF
jgi:hypothetical protein